MKHLIILICLFTLFLVTPTQAFAEKAIAIIHSTGQDALSGTVHLEETDTGLRIQANISGASPGKHGFHIHAYGSCDDSGKAAGGHYNPDAVDHGFVNKDSVFDSHPGDLGNITIGDDGAGSLALEVQDLSLSNGLFNVAGRAMIVHANPDDFGQPTGNAGGRIGCGTIVITG